MARYPEIDSATCQFFINHADNPGLNHRDNTPQNFGYAVFGKVIEGMDVVDAIANAETTIKGPHQNAPKETITPFMWELMNNRLAGELKEKIEFYEEQYGHLVYAEIFVTNKYGVNTGQSGKTSDYYQADEKWWQEAKEDGLYVSGVEYDNSAGVFSLDICARIDDENGNFLGVIKSVLNIKEVIKIMKELC